MDCGGGGENKALWNCAALVQFDHCCTSRSAICESTESFSLAALAMGEDGQVRVRARVEGEDCGLGSLRELETMGLLRPVAIGSREDQRKGGCCRIVQGGVPVGCNQRGGVGVGGDKVCPTHLKCFFGFLFSQEDK